MLDFRSFMQLAFSVKKCESSHSHFCI
jgi:hypothetical protein